MIRRKIYALSLVLLLLMEVIWGNSISAETLSAEEPYDVHKQADVIICGAEPEGIAAAVAAARNGLKTLLIDTRSYPGGLYTSGMLAMLDLNYDGGNEAVPVVNQGLFVKMYQNIGRSGALDINQTKTYFSNLLANYKVEVLYNVTNIRTIMQDQEVKAVLFDYGGRKIKAEAQFVVDAMQDAPVARMSGADYWVGREELGLSDYAGSTLVFSLKGVDWDEVHNYIKNNHNKREGWNKNVAWGYWQLLSYEPVSNPSGYQLRGLNLARQNDGSVVVNAFQIFGVDSLNPMHKKQAYEAACKEVPYIVSYLREHAKGFERAELLHVADELYIREGVRIVGEETLTAEDYFSNRDFDNKIAYGSYPVDLQSAKRDNSGGNGLSGSNIYTIPMGVMLPTKLENVLVVGRSASYDSIAHGSARTVPVGIALGEAAGEACVLAHNEGISLKTINRTPEYYKRLQQNLIAQGVTLNLAIKASNEETKNWSYKAIQNLRSQGFLAKGHGVSEGYGCNEQATFDTFREIISLIQFHSQLPINTMGKLGVGDEKIMTGEDVLAIVNQILGTSYSSIEMLYKAGILQQQAYSSILKTDKIYKSHAYVVMNDIVNYLRQKNPLPQKESLIHNDLRKN